MYVTGVNMASQVQDNKVECNLNINIEQEIKFKKVYEEVDRKLLNDKEKFENRAEHLVSAWRELRLCAMTSHIDDLKSILNWVKGHTLNIVLSGDWVNHKDKFEEKLISELEKCEKLGSSFAVHCKKLSKVICDPWGHPTLNRLLSEKDIEIGHEEFKFFIGESGFLISFRLKMLCENRCEDLALNLVTAYMNCCTWAQARNFNMNLTEDQKRFMLDAYISLLYKSRQTSVIVSTLKLLSLSEGLQLVQRFASKRIDVSKLWKHNIRITHLATVLFCSIAVMETLENSEGILKSLLDIWLPLHDNEESLNQLVCSIRRIMQLAISASHMYIFCEAIISKFGSKMKTFVVELYIQALTTDLNDLERQKNDNNKENESETSKRLASAFMKLADVLGDHINVSSECILTSFSLQPSKEALLKIEEIARQRGYEVLDTGQWKCKLHPPISHLDEICVECDQCGDFMGKLELEAALNTNLTLNDALTTERLGISSQLCDDLAVILCSPRYQFLSWHQEWRDLHRLCAMYLYNPERTKNYVTDLKFLDIDYNIFNKVKTEPEEEDVFGSINNCEDLMAAEFKIDVHINKSNTEHKKPGRKKIRNELMDVFIPPPKASTDPLVLKSLRSFRKTLKRTGSSMLENTPCEKVFVNSIPQNNLAQNTPVSFVNNQCKNVNSYENSFSENIVESNHMTDDADSEIPSVKSNDETQFKLPEIKVIETNLVGEIKDTSTKTKHTELLEDYSCENVRHWDNKNEVVKKTHDNKNIKSEFNIGVCEDKTTGVQFQPLWQNVASTYRNNVGICEDKTAIQCDPLLQNINKTCRNNVGVCENIPNLEVKKSSPIWQLASSTVRDHPAFDEHKIEPMIQPGLDTNNSDRNNVGICEDKSTGLPQFDPVWRNINNTNRNNVGVCEDKTTGVLQLDPVLQNVNDTRRNNVGVSEDKTTGVLQLDPVLQNVNDTRRNNVGVSDGNTTGVLQLDPVWRNINNTNRNNVGICEDKTIGVLQLDPVLQNVNDTHRNNLGVSDGKTTGVLQLEPVWRNINNTNRNNDGLCEDKTTGVLQLDPVLQNVNDTHRNNVGVSDGETTGVLQLDPVWRNINNTNRNNVGVCDDKTTGVLQLDPVWRNINNTNRNNVGLSDVKNTGVLQLDPVSRNITNINPVWRSINNTHRNNVGVREDKAKVTGQQFNPLWQNVNYMIKNNIGVGEDKRAGIQLTPRGHINRADLLACKNVSGLGCNPLLLSAKELDSAMRKIINANIRNDVEGLYEGKIDELCVESQFHRSSDDLNNIDRSNVENEDTQNSDSLSLQIADIIQAHEKKAKDHILSTNNFSLSQFNKWDSFKSAFDDGISKLNNLKETDGINSDQSSPEILHNMSEQLNPFLNAVYEFDIFKKSIVNTCDIPDLENIREKRIKDSLVYHRFSLNEVAHRNYIELKEKENFREREGSFSEKDDKVGQELNTEKLSADTLLEVPKVKKHKCENLSVDDFIKAAVRKVCKKKFVKAKEKKVHPAKYNTRKKRKIITKVVENDKLKALAEKYKLKELRVILQRLNFNHQEVNTGKKRGRKPKSALPKHNNNSNKRKENKRKIPKSQLRWYPEVPDMNKEEYKSSPLQDVNPRVMKRTETEFSSYSKKYQNITKDMGKMNPRVNLVRLDVDKLQNYNVNSILDNVPGLHDTEMIRPRVVPNVVQVVQIAGGRSTATVQATNNQTSTQVSPHIQRIGQPRSEKPETNTSDAPAVVTKSSTVPTNSKPTSTQPSTLINILSQQIIRPGQSTNTRPPRPPFINILSQQIIRPANAAASNKHPSSTASTEAQLQTSSARIVTSCDQQIINQLVSPVRSTGTLKTVVGTPVSDQSRIVQFICKSTDGKLIPVTSITANRVVKVATTQTVTSSSPGSPNFEDNFTKLVNTSPKTKNENAVENAESLPKFQQAFGKTVYQNNVESNAINSNINSNVNNSVDIDKAKLNIKNSTSLNVQPIPGGVIYTRQMPVGQAINIIPQSRVFRISRASPEQIALGGESVIQNKMSALLAAALQGKQKNSEVNDVETNSDSNSLPTAHRVAVTTRSALLQNARIVKPVLQVPTNVIRNTQTSLSSTTLEQLREFDMVYKQVKERSSTSTTSESNVLPENSDNSQRISVTYLNQGQKLNCAPVVVVSSYNNLQPAASPALSVASQGSSSPCVTPAPTPTPVLPKVAAKSSKGKSVKNTTMHTTKASPIPKPQQKPQEDEHTTQRIFDILAEYAEQLRNSPDLNNKPAPRRRSNPPTNPSQNSKRKKSTGSKKTGQCANSVTSDIDTEDPRTLGSEDSSCGVVQISMQDDEQTSVTANASESNDSNVQPRQQLILTESANNPTRNLIIADTSVGEALKMPNTAVLVPGNYIMPVSMVKGGQQIAVVSGGSKILATVPARSGPNMLLFQSFLNQNRKTNVSTVKYSTIQPISGITSQNLTATATQPPVILPSTPIGTVALSQPLTIKKMDENERVNTELLLTISQPQDNNNSTDDTQQPDSSTNIVQNNVDTADLEENATLSDNSSDKPYAFQKSLISTPIATPVIATCNKEDVSDDQTATSQSIMSLNLNNIEQNKGESVKVEERVQSVLVAAGTSNGPMLSHSPPHYNKQSECSESTTEQYKDDFLHNGGKRINIEQKNNQTNNTYTLQGKIKKIQTSAQKDRELLQHQQAALERELRFQKSLSEECEDLGVDEPSTSDLFPEADLLFDSNHSPSFDQSSQDILKRPIQCQDVKEESKLTLFSDEDFLFEPNDYQTAETELEYEEHSHILTNGQSNTPEESVSACEDNTLLQTCTSMSDVTLNSPISPDTFNPNTLPPLHKYIHKYTNRKKYDRTKQMEQWPVEVSSSEDTTGSTELNKSSSRSPDICSKRNDDELDENHFKVVHVAMSKSECDNIHCSNDTDCSLSGRGARKTVKKMCSCCNGSQDTGGRKRPASQPQTPYPHKKIFNKKR